ncbi:MAG: PilZ domain-containing protein [Candidatus Omnitrophota bacterium]
MMADSDRFSERRKSPRASISIPVGYKKLREAPKAAKGSLTKDVSTGGIRFVTDEFLSLTARLVLTIELPIPSRSVSAVCRVAWIKKLPLADRYEIGNQFLEMSRDDKERLEEYLSSSEIK